MANRIGPMIKEARTNAGLTQEKLAKKVDGLTASDIGKAERGEKELAQAQLKQIAKACGVTQSSLIEAAKASTYKGGSSKKPSSGSSSSKSKSMKLTATEKKLVELYREADSDTKKTAMGVLKGEVKLPGRIVGALLSNAASSVGSSSGGEGLVSSILGGLLGGDKD